MNEQMSSSVLKFKKIKLITGLEDVSSFSVKKRLTTTLVWNLLSHHAVHTNRKQKCIKSVIFVSRIYNFEKEKMTK